MLVRGLKSDAHVVLLHFKVVTGPRGIVIPRCACMQAGCRCEIVLRLRCFPLKLLATAGLLFDDGRTSMLAAELCRHVLNLSLPGAQILGGDLAGTVEEADPSSRFNVGDKVRLPASRRAAARVIKKKTS